MSTEMRPEQGIAGKFVRSALDENGVLSKIEFTARTLISHMM